MDNLSSYIETVKCTLIESPVRNYLSNEKNIPFRNVIKYNLDDVMNNFENILDKPKNTLKIAIMGEVKSGKSTLVNSIIGKEVSEVDVLEATSNIINLYYSNEDNYYKNDDCVNIGINSEFLKHINIVDTPGLKSITKENEDTSMRYIQKADLILFVFDSTHIGQEDIKDAIDLISSYGKPIIGILNKADLLEGDYEEILNYVSDEYSVYMDKFFIISSYLEYQHTLSKSVMAKENDIVIDYPCILSDNFTKFIEFLQEVCVNNDNIKIESIKSSIESLKHKEKVYHYEYLKSLEMLESEIVNHKKLLENKFEYIQAKMEFEINEWIDKKFLTEEISRINKSMDMASEYINDNYINSIINDKKLELDELFFKEWDECIKEVNHITNKNIREFIDTINYKNFNIELPKVKLNEEDININQMLATIGTGAILGATSGSAIAMYASAIGASAQSITIGTAMLTYCPPLLLAGTLTGGIGKVIYDKMKKDQLNKDIIIDIENFKESIKDDIKDMLANMYIKASKEIVKVNQGIFESSKDICMNEYEIEELKNKLQEYINQLQ
jgi:small GTP-binding protein